MKAKTFRELRRKVHAQSLLDQGNRLKRGPLQPTFQEICLGSFLDDIELQVRNAVLEMNRKGYCTWSSGFHGYKPKQQHIEGTFVIDKKTKSKLKKAGATVKTEKFWRRNYTTIAFYSKEPNTTQIKREWAQLISFIPSLGHKAILPQNLSSSLFWEHYTSSGRIQKLWLQRLIGANWNSRWMKRWKRQLRRLGRAV